MFCFQFILINLTPNEANFAPNYLFLIKLTPNEANFAPKNTKFLPDTNSSVTGLSIFGTEALSKSNNFTTEKKEEVGNQVWVEL